MSNSKSVLVPISPGELIDKITILEIKRERIPDAAKRQIVERELALLEDARARQLTASEELSRLTRELKTVNESLWQIEDDIRRCEHDRQFGARFVELARSIYINNDRRAELKRAINELLEAAFTEVKSYMNRT
jgi:hypothetical protein